MDPDIANWIIEFLLRQPIEDKILKPLLRSLPIRDGNANFKKEFLLNRLQVHVSRNSVSEATLELLGKLEALSGNETVSDTMKHAFCEVAVECTLKSLKAGDGDAKFKRFRFVEAVTSIWKEKIDKMQNVAGNDGLGSESLWAWKDEFEAASRDDAIWERVVKKGEVVNGVEAVNEYIREEKQKMGPTFLEIVAENVEKNEGLRGIMGLESPPPADANGADSGSNLKRKEEKIKLRQKYVPPFRRSRGLASRNSSGAKIVDPTEPTIAPSDKTYSVPSTVVVQKAREALRLSSLNLKNVVEDPLPDALEIARNLSEEARNKEPELPAEDNPASNARVTQTPVANTNNARPNLMERNNTVQRFEWDDSEDQASRGMARLPSPTRINTSPLSEYQLLKRRRKSRKWSSEEEDTLRSSVASLGKGNWKVILGLHKDVFAGRTEVDLKDKWRNMTRSRPL